MPPDDDEDQPRENGMDVGPDIVNPLAILLPVLAFLLDVAAFCAVIVGGALIAGLGGALVGFALAAAHLARLIDTA